MNTQHKPIGRLHVLTDFYFQQRYGHAELARLVIEGGADTIQFRQKFGNVRHKLYEARRTAAVCRQARIPLLIDDHLEIALAVGADGVHLGQEDFPIAEARRLLGPSAIIGATATTIEEAVEAWQAGADYIGFGPVFPTASKANPASVKGLEGLAAVCAAVPIPVIAIAGINVQRVWAVLEAGAYGVAVMTAITTAPDPRAAAAQFRAAIEAFLQQHQR
ncbi:thiamine phosphate synthase [Rhodothermus bifroesti]|uniref:Thiamine-phosphate synthase n=1 Tax=Rhodothermus marinus TaxID=29549 RepID=A0A7V2B0H5_RHOMR|nr:thiamine phosphate synthase [Rhodothermus bifroesti]GBD00675.1 Thiamine-phosphate synthase [bacterium HR18]